DPDFKQQCPDVTEEDLVQAVYAKLVNDPGTLERFEGGFDNSIFQYLGIIAINVVRDHFRLMLALKRPRVTFSLDQLTQEGDHALVDEGVDVTAPSPDAQRDVVTAQNQIEEVLQRLLKSLNG